MSKDSKKLTKARTTQRSAVTRAINSLEAEFQKDPQDKSQLNIRLQLLDVEYEKLVQKDQEVYESLLESDVSEDQLDREVTSTEAYRDDVYRMRDKTNAVLNPTSPCGSVNSENGASVTTKSSLKLPKIQMRKFNGEIKEWLRFWAQFSSIHEDPTIDKATKFQYLVQHTVPGTKARRVVESYPQSADNYEKAVAALKSRYGDETLLCEVYIRELLKLIISRVDKTKVATPLGQLYDELESYLRSLESLGVKPEQDSRFLYPMIESCLPEKTLEAWQRSSLSGYSDEDEKKVTPQERLSKLMRFLRQEVKGEERMIYVREGFDPPTESKSPCASEKQSKSKQTRVSQIKREDELPTVASLHIGEKQREKCIFCEGKHDSKECRKANYMSLEDKTKKIKEHRSCFACLKYGHRADECRAKVVCTICQRRHQTTMCRDLPSHKKSDDRNDSRQSKSEDTGKSATTSLSAGEVKTVNGGLACSTSIMLMTVMVPIIQGNKRRIVRLMIDCGAHRSCIVKKVASELDLKKTREEQMSHNLFGGINTPIETFSKFSVKLEKANQGIFEFEVRAKDKLCDDIPRLSHGPWLRELQQQKIWVNDIGTECPEIELLIGADQFGRILTGKIFQLRNGYSAIETIFGWTITGEPLGNPKSRETTAMLSTSVLVSESTVKDLWDLESIGIRDPFEKTTKTEQDIIAKKHFQETVRILQDGRYSVSLPWTNGTCKIEDNKGIAVKRLEATTRKLKELGQYQAYEKIFEEWLQEGIIEEVDMKSENAPCHYLPHRAVFKPQSTTTPIRPVFDASCKSQRSPSLNECLEKGPNLLELIPSLIIRFRKKKIGITSDVRKAFPMIAINEEDRDFLRFLWWKDADQRQFRTFRHKRVVFGVNSSPFILAAVIENHLSQVSISMKPLAKKLLDSLYVDNCVTSVDTFEEYLEFREKATQLMSEAKMELRLWQCSSNPEEKQVNSSNNIVSVLGLNWDTEEDSLCCDLEIKELPEKITKRTVLSHVQKIYDPMGFLSPAFLIPKKILQEAWKVNTGWDDPLPEEMKVRFVKWSKDLSVLKDIKVPRDETGGVTTRENWELRTFSDASQDAYAAAVFLRTQIENKISVQLIQAKARVSPLKSITIPRLELLGCTIAARLSDSVKKALSLEVTSFYWSDSSTALAWIRRNDEWGTFVGNRVREILKLTKVEEWNHVPGIENPADLPSRGCTPTQLLNSRWWEGPGWLSESRDLWPVQSSPTNEEEILAEKKKTVKSHTVMISTEVRPSWYSSSSSYYQNLRNIAWIIRFTYFKSKKESNRSKILSIQDISRAERFLLNKVQKEAFQNVKDDVSGIRVMRDEYGIIRVKTKLLNRDDPIGFRYPMLLPHAHPVTDQLIEYTHRSYGHAGVQFLMSNLREKYWILQSRKAIRLVVKRCVMCRRYSQKKVEVVPAPLPLDRIKTAKVFEVVGVDMAGPLIVKGGKKVWILLVCAVYRCVHLEVVDSISTEAFMEAFTHFTDRRGRPSIIYSDNGTNFVGARNVLKQINWERVTKTHGIRNMTWKFNPPSAAWWGGWWERLIRTMKDLLRKILGNSKVSEGKLKYVLSSVSAVMNERPLTTVSEDPDDLTLLTPAMFMTDIPVRSVPDLDLVSARELRGLYKERKDVLAEFKQRFRKEYLSLLVQRQRSKKVYEFRVGDVVLIGDDNRKRWQWPMARVTELIRRRDGEVRVVKLKTSTGTFTRPVQRVYPLEVSCANELPPIPIKDKSEENNKVSSDQNPEKDDPETHQVITRFGRVVKTPKKF